MIERLALVFREVFDDDTITPYPAMTAAEVEEWDSLSHIRLMIAIEQEFGIKFATSEISGYKDVGALVAGIDSKLSA